MVPCAEAGEEAIVHAMSSAERLAMAMAETRMPNSQFEVFELTQEELAEGGEQAEALVLSQADVPPLGASVQHYTIAPTHWSDRVSRLQ
jgi:hypothetical protein